MKKIELNEQVDRVKVLMGIKDTNVIVENNDLVDDDMIYENQESLDEQLKALLRNFSDDAIKLLGGEIKGLPMFKGSADDAVAFLKRAREGKALSGELGNFSKGILKDTKFVKSNPGLFDDAIKNYTKELMGSKSSLATQFQGASRADRMMLLKNAGYPEATINRIVKQADDIAVGAVKKADDVVTTAAKGNKIPTGGVQAPPVQQQAPSGFKQGLLDPFRGGAQLVAQTLGGLGSDYFKGEAARMGESVRAQEAEYQQQRAASGQEGFDVSRLMGNIVNPANLLPVVGTSPAARAISGGTVAGAFQPVLSEGDFAEEKAKQEAAELAAKKAEEERIAKEKAEAEKKAEAAQKAMHQASFAQPLEKFRDMHLIGFIVAGQNMHDHVDSKPQGNLPLPLASHAAPHGQERLAGLIHGPSRRPIIAANHNRGDPVIEIAKGHAFHLHAGILWGFHPNSPTRIPAREILQQIKTARQHMIRRDWRQGRQVQPRGQLLQYTAFLGRLANPRNVTIPCVE